MEYPINVSPDDLPLDIELHNVDDLAAVIRAIQQCSQHDECRESPLKIELIVADGQAEPSLSPSSIQDEAIFNPVHDYECGHPSIGQVEARLDWITDQINDWYGSISESLVDSALNSLTLKIDEMFVGSPAGDLCIENEKLKARVKELEESMRPKYNTESPVPISDASYQRARKLFATWQAEAVTHNIIGKDQAINFFASKLARVFDENQKNVDYWAEKERDATEQLLIARKAAQPDPTDALAKAFEVDEIHRNNVAVGYMRERIQQLEAEKDQLAQMLHNEKTKVASLKQLHSTQKADLDKLIQILTTWGWDAGDPFDWLLIYVDTLVKNGREAASQRDMRTGELQEAIRIKNEVLDENKKSVADNIQIRRNYSKISDDYSILAGKLDLEIAANTKLQKSHDRLNAKYHKLREKLKV